MKPIAVSIKYTIPIDTAVVINLRPPKVKILIKNVTFLITGKIVENTKANNKQAIPNSTIVPLYSNLSGKNSNNPKNTTTLIIVAPIILEIINTQPLYKNVGAYFTAAPTLRLSYFTALVFGKRLLPGRTAFPTVPLAPPFLATGVCFPLVFPCAGAGSLAGFDGVTCSAGSSSFVPA